MRQQNFDAVPHGTSEVYSASDVGRRIVFAPSGATLTWPDLTREARAIVCGLVRRSVRRGDVIGFEGQQGVSIYPLAVACSRLGISLLPAETARSRRPKLMVVSEALTGRRSSDVTMDELRRVDDDDVLPPGDDPIWMIRPLRTPLRLLRPHPNAIGEIGEIVLQSGVSPQTTFKTGDVGWMDTTGALVLEGKLVDVAVRNGSTILLSDVDAALQGCDAVSSSVSFLERAGKLISPIVATVASGMDEADLRSWLAAHVDPLWIADIIVARRAFPPALVAAPDAAPTLRAVFNGEAGAAVVDVLTARRFRRSPCFKEDVLRTRVQHCLLNGLKLRFLMFWGCGPRPVVAAPDVAALRALQDLLNSIAQVAPLETSVDVIFTDGHATNNGHSIAHYQSYFASVCEAAAGLPATFHLESEVWRRGGLSRDAVYAFEQRSEFLARWNEFTLRERFILQASRHSRMDDRVAAARHYYATCLLERQTLAAQFPDSVFLTYNGPEFNECFPDLPTLYIYPGPRGRTDKPWFVHEDAKPAQSETADLAVAAE